MSKIIQRGLIDGIALSITTSAALLTASRIECGSSWAAINPICHITDGDERSFGDEFDARDSLLGLGISSSVMCAWGVLHAVFFRKVKWPESLAAGGITAAGAYLIDYYLVPRRFTPGIEKKLSPRAILAAYAILGLTLGIAAKFHRSERN